MARIRSIHPSQATDEDFVAMSPMARLLALHIRCEADDSGIFEWKPLGLKMRIFPADDADIGALLKELEDNNQVKRFESAGKTYGAIRNFRKYQRPKKPNSLYPCPAVIRTYVGLKPSSPEPVENPPRTGGENPPQMEDGGDKVEDGGGDPQSKPIGINSNSGGGACGKSASRAFDIDLFLRDADIARFRQDFSGYDRHHLMREFNHWIASKKPPDKPVAAFFAFCRTHTNGKPAARTAHG